MKKVYALLALATALTNHAQSQPKAKWRYSNQTTVGVMEGGSDADYAIQTIHGWRQRNSFAGVGFGLDPYGVSSLPLIVHGERAFGKGRSRPFVYGQAGANLPWHQGVWGEKIGKFDAYKIETGAIAEFGAGYKFRSTKKMQLTASLGYSYKNSWVAESQFRFGGWLPLPESTVNYQRYFYQMQRYAFKIGIAF